MAVLWQREKPLRVQDLKGDHLVGKYYVLFETKYREQLAAMVSRGKSQEVAEKNAPLLLEAKQMLRQWENNDPQIRKLWAQMNRWVYDGFDVTYDSLGIDFDSNYYESETYLLGKSIIEEGLNKGVFYSKEDGSVWIDLNDEGLGRKIIVAFRRNSCLYDTRYRYRQSKSGRSSTSQRYGLYGRQ